LPGSPSNPPSKTQRLAVEQAASHFSI